MSETVVIVCRGGVAGYAAGAVDTVFNQCECVLVMVTDVDPAMKRQLRMLLSDPVELGVHLVGPKLLARNEQAALGLRAVYGNTWGLDIELKLGRATEPAPRPFPAAEHGDKAVSYFVDPPLPPGKLPQTVPADPMEGFRFGLGFRSGAVRLDALPPGPCEDPEGAWPSWRLSHMVGSGHLGMDIAVLVWPYPTDGIIWLGWSWPELALPEGETMIAVPPLKDISHDVVTLRHKPEESQLPADVLDHLERLRAKP